MLLAQVLTLLLYIGALIALSSPDLLSADAYFDIRFFMSFAFYWRVAAITIAATVPIWLFGVTTHVFAPRVTTKLG